MLIITYISITINSRCCLALCSVHMLAYSPKHFQTIQYTVYCIYRILCIYSMQSTEYFPAENTLLAQIQIKDAPVIRMAGT